MKTCAVCPCEIPDTRRHTTCSPACRRLHRHRLWTGQKPSAAALAGRRVQARKVTEDRIRAEFGPTLSARDIALFQAGMRLGYAKGYSVAWRRRLNAKVAA